MAWNITRTSRVPILKPCSSHLGILLIYDMLDILELFLNLVCHEDPRHTGTNSEDAQFAINWVLFIASA